VSGESGWYCLVDPALSATQPHVEAEPAVTLPPGLFVQREGTQKKTPERALDLLGCGALVLREDIARAALAGTGVTWRPITIRLAGGAPVKGWVIVIVDEFAPLDRAVVQASWHPGEPLLNAYPKELISLEWREDRAPRAPLFRIVEAPQLLVATAELAEKLSRATGRTVNAGDPSAATMFAPSWAEIPAFDVPAKAAAAAEEACARMIRGETGEALRGDVLTHPLYALTVALGIDRAPRADTRAAASKHPVTAVQYAILVDRAAHPATRAGADAEVWCAHRYAYALDKAIPDAIAARMIASKCWDEANVGELRDALAELSGQPPKRAGQVATRELPAPPQPPPPRVSARLGEEIADPEVRADIDEMTGRGLAQLGITADLPVPEVIDALHGYVDKIRVGEVKLGRSAGTTHLALACVLAEQLHRAFGWQWATVDAAVCMVSPDRAHAHQPLALLERVARRHAPANTIALFFNMVAASKLPKSKKGALTFVS
jgi:hypothetical protein